MLINGVEEQNLYNYDLSQDQIIIIDEIFPEWFVEHVHHAVFDEYSWYYGHTSNYPEDNRDIGADPDWPEIACLKQQIYPAKSNNAQDSCFRMIYNAIARLIPFEVELGEALVNGQQYIHETVPHKDCDCDNGISWIYYVNKHWKDSWGGPTKIQIDGCWQDVLPKPGRVCLIKGNLLHHGCPPNKEYKGCRASLVYKTMRKIPLPARPGWNNV